MAPKRKTGRRYRTVVITPLGHRILAAIERGAYRFDTRSERMVRENARRRARSCERRRG